jgi:hypothetical protein
MRRCSLRVTGDQRRVLCRIHWSQSCPNVPRSPDSCPSPSPTSQAIAWRRVALVGRVDNLRLVAVPAGERVTPQRDPALPAARREPTNARHAFQRTSWRLDYGMHYEMGSGQIPPRLEMSALTWTLICTPNGVRTRVSTLRGWCPRPLDDGGV